jgi:hypothetical protein
MFRSLELEKLEKLEISAILFQAADEILKKARTLTNFTDRKFGTPKSEVQFSGNKTSQPKSGKSKIKSETLQIKSETLQIKSEDLLIKSEDLLIKSGNKTSKTKSGTSRNKSGTSRNKSGTFQIKSESSEEGEEKAPGNLRRSSRVENQRKIYFTHV